MTLQQFVDHLDLTDSFKNEFFYPFLAGGWGVPPEVFQTFAAYNVLKYMVMNQPTGLQPIYWNEVIGGTISYIQALTKQLAKTSIKLSASIEEVTYANDRYIIVEADGTVSEFDYLVLATNAFEANKLLKYIPETLDVRTLLGKVKYFHTSIAVHGDPRFMPADPSDWSVANVRYDGSHSAMTFYKAWRDSPSPIFRSWLTFDVRPASENGQPLPDPLYGLVGYWHPKVDLQYFETQKAIQDINGNRRLWFAGLYTEDVDAHESAIVSAIRIAEALAPQADRLLQLKKETTPYIVF